MAFGGSPEIVSVQPAGRGGLLAKLSGATLSARVGAFDATGAAPDSGLLSSNAGAIDEVPANTMSLPASFGPGPDDWTQEDVDTLLVHANDTVDSSVVWNARLVANAEPAPPGSSLTNNNVVIGLHNTNPVAASGLVALIQLLIPHS